LLCPHLCCNFTLHIFVFLAFSHNKGPCHVSGIFLPLRVNSLPLATIYEVKIPLRKWKKSLLQRNPAQMTWANLMKHQFNINNDVDSTCRLCLEVEETSWHVIAECSALIQKRWEIFHLTIIYNPLNWSIKQVTRFLRESSIGDLLDQMGPGREQKCSGMWDKSFYPRVHAVYRRVYILLCCCCCWCCGDL
jgi:hypothetical protein